MYESKLNGDTAAAVVTSLTTAGELGTGGRRGAAVGDLSASSLARFVLIIASRSANEYSAAGDDKPATALGGEAMCVL